MSYMALYGVWPGEKTEEAMKFGNSWGGLSFVWEVLAGRYLNVAKSYSYPEPGWMQLGDKLWDMWKDQTIPEEFRLVFMWGFDRGYLAKENYERMAKAIRSFLKAFPPKAENVNHWDSIASFLEGNPEYPALGIYGTSCGDNCWHGEYDEDGEEKPIEWGRYYEVCAEIDSLKEPL